MRHRFLASLFIVFPMLTLAPTTAQSQESSYIDDHEYLVNIPTKGSIHLLKGEYNEVEEYVAHLLTKEPLSPSGISTVSYFYKMMSLLIVTPPDEETTKIVFSHLQKWEESFPKSLIPKILLANAYIERAWAYRGGSYAREVEKNNWEPFRENIKKARSQLESIKEDSANNPEWYNSMMLVAIAQDWPKEDYLKLFKEASDKFPNYQPIYSTAATAMLPKWGGSWAKVDDIANTASQNTKSSDGESRYARLYWTVINSLESEDFFRETKVNWGRLKQGYKDMIKLHPDPYNKNAFALFACLAKDKETTKQMIDELGVHISPRQWKRPEILEYCKAFAATKK